MKRRKQAHITFKREKSMFPPHEMVWAVYGQFADRPVGFMFSSPSKKRAKDYLDGQLAHLKYSFIIYLNGRRLK